MPYYKNIYTRKLKEFVWWIERDSIGIAEYDSSQEQKKAFTSPESVFKVYLFYIKKADHFYTLDSDSSEPHTEESELPSEFHQYIVDKAIQYGYEEKPEQLKTAMYYENRFERGIKEGKAYANRGRVGGMRSVKQHGF
tara:strand:+ start:1088 stop:1501 length:414 start_codon:yes stop_codon:yes gene_type:complete